MKKSTKTVLILASVFLALGLVICASVFAFFRGDVFDFEEYGYRYMEYTCEASQVRELKLKDSNNKVSLLPAQDSRIKVCYYVTERDYYDISLEDGSLQVLRKDKRRWLDGFRFHNLQEISLKVYVPSGILEEVFAQTSNGNLSFSDIDIIGSLTLTSSNGKVRVENINAGGGINITTSNGKIEIIGAKAGGRLSAATSNGGIEAENLTAEDIDLENSNSAITASETAAAERLSIESSNGSISVSGIEGRSIELSTSNSRISGSISGRMSDYAISSRTSNGSNNLPNGTEGERTLVAETSNGSIDLQFED